MGVYKDKSRGDWYVSYRYVDSFGFPLRLFCAQKNIYVIKLSGADNEPFWFSRKEKDDLLR